MHCGQNRPVFLGLVFLLLLAVLPRPIAGQTDASPPSDAPYVTVLGIAQDGGFPQANCYKECCRDLQGGPIEGPACLAVVDPQSGQRWLFECTPEFPRQLARLNAKAPVQSRPDRCGFLMVPSLFSALERESRRKVRRSGGRPTVTEYQGSRLSTNSIARALATIVCWKRFANVWAEILCRFNCRSDWAPSMSTTHSAA